MGAFAGPHLVTDGLVLALDGGSIKSYPGSGTTWFDLSGNANNGTLSGAAMQDNGTPGRNIGFDGTDDKVTINAAASLRPATAISMEAWLYMNTLPTSQGWYTIIQAPQSNASHLDPYFDWAIYINATGGLHTRINGVGNPNTVPNYTTTYLAAQKWNHVAITWTAGTVRYYINGALIQTAATTQNTIVYDNNTNVLIGLNASNGEDFNGNLAYVRVYNIALTDAQVLQNYQANKTRFGY